MIDSIISSITGLFSRHEPDYTFNEQKLRENHKRFTIIEASSFFTLFLYLGLMAFLTYFIAGGLHELIINYFFQSNYLYTYYAPKPFWVIPGAVLGFATIIKPMEFVYKRILKDDYAYYTEWTNRKHGYNGLKIIKPITHIFAIATIIIVIAAFDWHLKIDDNNFVINDFFSLKDRVYKMTDIENIRYYQKDKAPNGQVNNFPHYKVNFNDGYSWTPDVFEIEEEKRTEIFEFLASKAGMEIEYKEIDEN